MALILIILHAIFFMPVFIRAITRRDGGPPRARAASLPTGVRAALSFHGAALAALYVGLVWALVGGDIAPAVTSGAVAGLLVLAPAIALHVWSVRALRSWRLAPQIDAGHELCTHGPYGLVRHPIYLAIDLLAVGTAFWVSTPIIIAAAVALIVGGELRARLEERALRQAFGDAYAAYARQVKRLVPGVY